MNMVQIIKENPFLGYTYRKLTSIVEIVPYYLFEEFLTDHWDTGFKGNFDGFEVCFLRPSDMKTISLSPEVNDSEHRLVERLANDCLCLGLKYNGEIAAYTWCNLKGGLSLISPLRDDEAYLFDARTLKAYRGKNLAPYLRYQLYKHLTQIGRTKFFSISSVFNTSAINFKKKLRAKPLKLYLQIRLFRKYQWDIILKDYERKENFKVKGERGKEKG